VCVRVAVLVSIDNDVTRNVRDIRDIAISLLHSATTALFPAANASVPVSILDTHRWPKAVMRILFL